MKRRDHKMKRFTETQKWDDPWFRDLPPKLKLAFLFIIDACDNAGFWEVDFSGMAFKTGMTKDDCEGAIKGLGRGLVGAC
jgi:hypothetical protein